MGNFFTRRSLGARAQSLEEIYTLVGSEPNSPRPLRLRRRAYSIAAPFVTEPMDDVCRITIPQRGSVFFFEDEGDESVLVEVSRGPVGTGRMDVPEPTPNVYRPGYWHDDVDDYDSMPLQMCASLPHVSHLYVTENKLYSTQ